MKQEDEIFYIANKRLTELLEQFDSLSTAKKLLEEREAELQEDWKAWYHIWSKEKPVLPVPEEQMTLTSESGSNVEGLAEPYMEIENRVSKSNAYGSKTAIVKDILLAVGENGITPKELSEELAKRGVKASESFAGNALYRLKKGAEVTTLPNGRYVWFEVK